MEETIASDEENVVTVQVKEGMTEEEIMDLVLQRVEGDLPLKEDPSRDLCTSICNCLCKAITLFNLTIYFKSSRVTNAARSWYNLRWSVVVGGGWWWVVEE